MTNDQRFFQGILSGDDKIIRQIYEDYFPRIRTFIENNGGQEEDALDIFQEAVMTIYHKAQAPNFVLNSSLYTLIYAISRNLWFNQLKKKKLERVTNPQLNLSIEEETIDQAIHQRAKYRLFRAKFQLLEAGCQRILELFFAGTAMRQIAAQLNLSEKYVRKRKFLCKQKLVEMVQQDALFQELK